MIGWIKNAAALGAASGVVTLTLNSLGLLTSTPDSPRSDLIPALGFMGFIGLMMAVGFTTTRDGGSVGRAAVAGLIGGAVSSVGTMVAAVIVVLSSSGQATADDPPLLIGALTLAIALAVSLVGLGVGAGMGAIGGAFGRRPAARSGV